MNRRTAWKGPRWRSGRREEWYVRVAAGISDMDPRLPSLVALNGRISPSLSSFVLSNRLREVMLATHGPSAASRLGVWSIRRPCSDTPPLLRPPLLIASAPGWGSRSRRMPCEPLDALEHPTKETYCQGSFRRVGG